VLLLALASTGVVCAQGAEAPLAVIDGKPVSRAEVEASAADQFRALEREYTKNRTALTESSLQRLLEERLLDAEAKAKGVPRDQLLSAIAPPAVTDADVKAFYEANKAQISQPMDQIAGQIKGYLEQQRQGEARAKYIDGLREKHGVKILLEPDRIMVAANGPSKGPADAPVTIVEFSDFQCPYCARLTPTMEQVMSKYGDKVRRVFRQFPLNFHPFAQKAAEASLCANEQGVFWQLHDAMFGNQQALGVDQLKTKAAEIGVDAGAFNQCLDSGKYAAAIQTDIQDGSAAGVNGTPALFINGRMVTGAVPIDQITKVIDDELRRKGATGG
jgi:protein-disulfide isomerase